jgi:CRP-like cAMP-binding protein
METRMRLREHAFMQAQHHQDKKDQKAMSPESKMPCRDNRIDNVTTLPTMRLQTASRRRLPAATDPITLVSHAELRRMLGGPPSSPDGHCDQEEAAIALVRVHLAPGEVLYAEGSRPVYGYFVESGVIQCVRRHGGDATHGVSHVAAHGLLGIERLPERRHETATALNHVSLLAMPMASVQEVEAASPILRELLARPLGQGLLRDWRTVYRLRGLPPFARTEAGLSYIHTLAATPGKPGTARMPVVIDVHDLCRWLALPLQMLEGALNLLQSRGALEWRDGVIHALMPQVLGKTPDPLKLHTSSERISA